MFTVVRMQNPDFVGYSILVGAEHADEFVICVFLL